MLYEGLTDHFSTSVLFAPGRNCSILITVLRVAAILAVQQPSHRKTTVLPRKRIRPQGKTHLSVSQTKLSRASFSLEDRCLRMIRFQSPVIRQLGKRKLNGISVWNTTQHLFASPLTRPGLRWIERRIGADNGYQPYYPTVILEPRYLDGVVLQALTPVSTAHKSGGRHLRSRSRHDNDPNRAIAAGQQWRLAARINEINAVLSLSSLAVRFFASSYCACDGSDLIRGYAQTR